MGKINLNHLYPFTRLYIAKQASVSIDELITQLDYHSLLVTSPCGMSP